MLQLLVSVQGAIRQRWRAVHLALAEVIGKREQHHPCGAGLVTRMLIRRIKERGPKDVVFSPQTQDRMLIRIQAARFLVVLFIGTCLLLCSV